MYQNIIRTSRQDNRRLLKKFQISVAFIFSLILAIFWNFQVGQYSRFAQMADNNYQRIFSLRAPRGTVFDRFDRVLIENRFQFSVSFVREYIQDPKKSISLLAELLDIKPQNLYDLLEENHNLPPYQPFVLVPDVSLNEVATIFAHIVELPGVVVEEVPARHYPYGRLGSHLFGYIGELRESQVNLFTTQLSNKNSIVGQSGIEEAYNTFLMGKDGTQTRLINSIGREIEILDEEVPIIGGQLKLTIDIDLQKATEDAFNMQEFSGAAVVLDPATGEVLALVSLPGYDPNDFALGIEHKIWSELNDNSLKPLQNRSIQGLYSPGSTFKLIMAVASLEEGIVTPDFKVRCQGGSTFYDRFYRCNTRHGTVTMDEAIEKSCNTYFYTLGSMLDIDIINKWAKTFGLGELSGIGLSHERKGLVPSREWKWENQGERWYPGETISVSIGQGPVSLTPMSLAVMMATIANGGKQVTPQLLKATHEDGDWVEAVTSPVSEIQLQPETVETLHRGLWMAVNRQGTGRRAHIPNRDVIGKTGTAQVASLQSREEAGDDNPAFRDHSWFVFSAPMNDPKVAGVIFAEHGEHGYMAASIARKVMETFFAKQKDNLN